MVCQTDVAIYSLLSFLRFGREAGGTHRRIKPTSSIGCDISQEASEYDECIKYDNQLETPMLASTIYICHALNVL